VVAGTEVGSDQVSDSGLQPVLWPLELPLLLRRTTTDLATATTGRDTTYPDLTLIMAVRFIMDRGTIAGEHLLTGKERARFIRAFLFASLFTRPLVADLSS
jgi:hypothetical protein